MESGQGADASDVDEPTTISENATSKQGDSSSHGPTIDPILSDENKPGEILRNLQNVSYIYRQDVVRSKTNNKIGIVTEVAGDSDSESSITDDEDEDEGEKDNEAGRNDEGDVENKGDSDKNAAENTDGNDSKHTSLTADQVRVLWMDESETTESIDDVTVVDRVDLLTHDGSIVKDKPSRDLKRIRDFTVGDHVVLGPWLGRIEDVFDNVTVLFDDGSVCKVMKADPLRLKPVGKNILEDGHFPYYPGQRVKASSSSVFKNSRWLSGLWKANRLEGTVIKVTVGSLFIYWIALLGDWCLLPSLGSTPMPLDKGAPKSESHDCVKDEPESTETGDESDAEGTTTEESTGYNRSTGNDSEASSIKNDGASENSAPTASLGGSSVSDSKGTVHENWPLHRKKIRKVVVRKDKKARKRVENFERALLIINTKTKVDVAWQDGTVERGLDSTSLIPIDSPGDHEFVAEQYVVEKAADDSNDGVEIRRVGVVKSVNAKDRTACVRWLKPVARAEDPREFDKEEVVSAYELEGHPDYDYCYGDVVVRLSPVSLPTKMNSFVHSIEDTPLMSPDESKPDKGKHDQSKSIENTSARDMSIEFSDLSWVGNITGLKDGDIEVTWADGIVSTVGPQAIYVVGRDDEESIAAGSYPSDDAASWETVEDDTIETVNNVEEDQGTIDASQIMHEIEDSDIAAENSGNNGALSIPLAALGFMTRLAFGIFSNRKKQSDSLDLDTKIEDDLQSNELLFSKDSRGESSSQKPNDVQYQLSELPTNSEGEEHDVIEAVDLLEGVETVCNLRPPESDGAPPCDEFISTFKGFDIVRDPTDHYFLNALGQNNAPRKWLKKVQRDWDILQNNLPEGIYVRVYEDRMDLLRAVIVGAYGTPYQDGLFFFDFLLPPEYPDVPPSVYYHSGGWRINPNLYEEGKVCLSLLNTWTGRGNEVWDPSSSSILQVLVSLQGLVLNSKPYFNEAGYDKQDFKELVNEHFQRRGYFILKACDAYMKGHLIGSLRKDASISPDNNANSNSVGFKLMLAKVVPRLFSALNEVGADCQEFKHLIQS
ncbi:UNVERIFIED_CONTAM: putative ubiquitin-conjugating enzyme E2 23 [Sesamum radiatum]|uniref:Ubiquitin-conjugating enzyme E2 23 n=1 Tax=Sesamum radiatum TaxID=300843 RepID=A0AAW2RUS2_SESRA